MPYENFERGQHVDWNNCKLAIVTPDGNVGIAKTKYTDVRLAIQVDWRYKPTDADIRFAEQAIKQVLPTSVMGLDSVVSDTREEREAAMNAFLQAPNN